MQATSDEVYKQTNNALYNEQGNIWRDENECLHLLKSSVNPARVGYFRRLLDQVFKFDFRGAAALDVGCGGGILAEEFAGMGFRVTGIDPSEQSLHAARKHAQSMELSIQYQEGTGESIPFADNTYPVVYCCDVLEHVRDLPKVISEIYRVTKPGGVFFFDTLNRTFVSKLVAIKVWQESKSTAFMPAAATRVENVYPAGRTKRIACAGRIRVQGISWHIAGRKHRQDDQPAAEESERQNRL